MTYTFTVASRFNGPPNSGNGGYAAGLLARHLAQPVNVRLQKPIPLDTPLSIRQQQERWEAYDGDQLIALARPPARAVPAAPTKPSFVQAHACLRDAPAADSTSTFTQCFVCGAGRAEGDGLRVLAGRFADGVVAAPWTPHVAFANASGQVEPEYVWAALDCPGMFAAFPDGRYALLGELAVELHQPVVHAREPHVVVGWLIAEEGRKRTAGTALIDASGECRAQAIATWIQIDR